MSGYANGWEQLLHGGAVPQTGRQATGPMEGEVIDVSADGVIVTLDDFGADQKFGRCIYGRTSTPPQVGDRALVLFVGQGIENPWLIRWAAPA